MPVGDVRAVLQYVPLFRGRTFVVLFDEGLLPEPAVAETLLDLHALQTIWVQLVIGVLGGDVDELANWATELEIKFTYLPHGSIGYEGTLTLFPKLISNAFFLVRGVGI